MSGDDKASVSQGDNTKAIATIYLTCSCPDFSRDVEREDWFAYGIRELV
ncbi:hypothetical protein [Nostoc sp.]